MSADKMPPLPASLEIAMALWRDCMSLDEIDEEQAADAFDAEVRAYARAYAAEQVRELVEALNAMLTHMGMDEDEWNKPTFDQARRALAKHKEQP